MVISSVNSVASSNAKSYSGDKVTNTTNVEKAGVTVDLSSNAQQYLNRGVASENTLAKGIDYGQESVNFSKENISSYSGSFMTSQANTHSAKVASLTA